MAARGPGMATERLRWPVLGSLLWQSKGSDDASGKSCDGAMCARFIRLKFSAGYFNARKSRVRLGIAALDGARGR